MNTRTCTWLLTVAIGLGGCTPAGAPLKHGEITLNYESTSETALTLTLTNGLDREVVVTGDRTIFLEIRVWPPNAEISCQSSASSALTTEVVGLSRGSVKDVPISPNKIVKIVVPTTLPHQSQGGQCTLYLNLKDGTRVGPVEFRPE